MEQESIHKNLANAIRILSVEMVSRANSGHPGMPLGAADIATVLFSKILRFSPQNPKWLNRDRFVLSAGHASALLYSLLYLTGYEDCTLDELKNFRQLHSKTAGHPEYGFLSGIETTTGPLGQGIANAVGMAISERKLHNEFSDLIDYKTYCLCGDGCIMEGIALESLQIAGHLGLSNFVLIYDKNNITIDGDLSMTSSVDYPKMLESFGFNVLECDGHSSEAIEAVLLNSQNTNKPTAIIATTKIGFGSTKEGSAKAHGSPLSKEDIIELKQKLGVNYNMETIPQDTLSSWRKVGQKGDNAFKRWNTDVSESGKKNLIENFAKRNYKTEIGNAINKVKEKFLKEKPQSATRVLSGSVLEELSNLPFVIGGSADLSGSNNTKSARNSLITNGSFSGNYIAYGVREHAMAGIMNGLALSGFLPFGGTFLVFSDYMRNSIRLSALMKAKVFYIMTHDSIGLGEDGPTHQPVEHLASLRAIPNLNVFRPCDAIETANCFAMANELEGPSLFALSRQNLPLVSTEFNKNTVKYGGYIIHDCQKPEYTIIATGSEVSLAIEVANTSTKNIRVVSVPCLEIFRRQSNEYINETLGNETRIFIEAGVVNSFYGLLRAEDLHFTVDTFGHSGKAGDVYNYFGITVENILLKI
ncbi:MAG: transketolase [Candidatus Deianiraeaceae bacterium]|jgi:transketolase